MELARHLAQGRNEIDACDIEKSWEPLFNLPTRFESCATTVLTMNGRHQVCRTNRALSATYQGRLSYVASAGQCGEVVSAVFGDRGSKARNCVDQVVVTLGRVVDRVPAAAGGAPLQTA